MRGESEGSKFRRKLKEQGLLNHRYEKYLDNDAYVDIDIKQQDFLIKNVPHLITPDGNYLQWKTRYCLEAIFGRMRRDGIKEIDYHEALRKVIYKYLQWIDSHF